MTPVPCAKDSECATGYACKASGDSALLAKGPKACASSCCPDDDPMCALLSIRTGGVSGCAQGYVCNADRKCRKTCSEKFGECPFGQYCKEGICTDGCIGDGNCAEGTWCALTHCREGACDPKDPDSCGAFGKCDRGVCKYSECQDSEISSMGDLYCLAKHGQGWGCVKGLCVSSYCEMDRDCPLGQKCGYDRRCIGECDPGPGPGRRVDQCSTPSYLAKDDRNFYCSNRRTCAIYCSSSLPCPKTGDGFGPFKCVYPSNECIRTCEDGVCPGGQMCLNGLCVGENYEFASWDSSAKKDENACKFEINNASLDFPAGVRHGSCSSRVVLGLSAPPEEPFMTMCSKDSDCADGRFDTTDKCDTSIGKCVHTGNSKTQCAGDADCADALSCTKNSCANVATDKYLDGSVKKMIGKKCITLLDCDEVDGPLVCSVEKGKDEGKCALRPNFVCNSEPIPNCTEPKKSELDIFLSCKGDSTAKCAKARECFEQRKREWEIFSKAENLTPPSQGSLRRPRLVQIAARKF